MLQVVDNQHTLFTRFAVATCTFPGTLPQGYCDKHVQHDCDAAGMGKQAQHDCEAGIDKHCHLGNKNDVDIQNTRDDDINKTNNNDADVQDNGDDDIKSDEHALQVHQNRTRR